MTESVLLRVESRYPEWINRLKQQKILPKEYEILRTQSGLFSLRVTIEEQKLFFHSPYDPFKEAVRLAKSLSSDKEALVLGGLGLGYLAEEFLRRVTCPIIIVECDWNILKLALEHRGLEELLKSPRVYFWMKTVDELIVFLSSKKIQNFDSFIHSASKRLHSEYYETLESALQNYQNRQAINRSTLRRFERLWTRNLLKNLVSFVPNRGVEMLFGKFSQVPCIVVCAGPSLEKNIHFLASARKKALLIVVDTVFPILVQHGIESDFVVSIDPQGLNQKYFDSIPTEKTILLCDPCISHGIVRRYSKKHLMFSSNFQLVEWLESLSSKKGKIEMGGSVATASYSLAERLGCNPIVFVGLDLAYSQQKTHMKGNVFIEEQFYLENRLSPAQGVFWQSLRESGRFLVEGQNGKKIWTDRKFQSFQRWLESRFKSSTRRIINATEGGVFLKHCEEKSLEGLIQEELQFLKDFQRPNFHGPALKKKETLELFINPRDQEIRCLKHIEAKIQNIIESLTTLKQESQKGIDYVQELFDLNLSNKESQKTKQRIQILKTKLENIDKKLLENSDIHTLLSLSIQTVLHEFQISEQNEKQKTLLLYQGILEGIEFNRLEFFKAQKRLQKQLKQLENGN